jgi:DNA helicase HerA-like ATPase
MSDVLGRVESVAGSRVTAIADGGQVARIGALVKVVDSDREAVGIVAAIEARPGDSAVHDLIIDLLGQVARRGDGARSEFQRGVTHYPSIGATVALASDDDLAAIYAEPTEPYIRIGTIYGDRKRPAYVLVDDLLAKHFAVLGTSGSGKSCAVALVLASILERNRNAHVVLLDPHAEYSNAFGEIADRVNVDNLRLPLWLLNFEEACRTLIRGGTVHEQQSQAEILKNAIAFARRHHAKDAPASSITVDTPVPFNVFDLVRHINEEMGRLGKPDSATPYLRLRSRLESMREDRRFAFMFDRLAEDNLSEIIGRMLRIPVGGKPLTIIDLSGVPAEVTDVVVSLLCRMIFDFALWADRSRMPPLLLVCEEAQRYVPADERIGFAETARAISRIAKEGRKYGISLALVTQRPTELSVHALSQCGTVFALRLGEELDQRYIANMLPNAPRGMLAALPSLPTQEAIVFGEGVRLPMRVRFNELLPEERPRSENANFSQDWQSDTADAAFRDDSIRRWRNQIRS